MRGCLRRPPSSKPDNSRPLAISTFSLDRAAIVLKEFQNEQ
jgi:hypothetical protein